MEHIPKEALLQAAVELFGEYGYNKVSIRQIADKAHTNSAMISYYFGSKHQLYEAAFISQISALKEFIVPVLAALDPRDVIRRYAAAMEKIHAENPLLLNIICRELSDPAEQHNMLPEKIGPQLYRILSETLTRGISQGLFREELAVRPAVILLVGVANFYYLTHNIHSQIIGPEKETEQEDTYMKQAVEIFLTGIERRPHP